MLHRRSHRELVDHHAFQPHVTPIQVFNKATDPFLPGVKPHLFQVLQALDARGYTNHVLVITRFKVTAADMAASKRSGTCGSRCCSPTRGIPTRGSNRSRNPKSRSPRSAPPPRHKQRTGVVLYWRPIVPGWNDRPETMARVLDVGRDVDAIVFTGYYHKPENAEYLRGLGVARPLRARTTTAARPCPPTSTPASSPPGASPASQPRCSARPPAASRTPTNVADYNGHWGVRELCDICPAAQQQRAPTHYRDPTPATTWTASSTSSATTADFVIEDGHVWTHGLGEQKRYAIQHTLGYQIWELDQPHYLHAHGRSLTGHEIDPDQAKEIEEVEDSASPTPPATKTTKPPRKGDPFAGSRADSARPRPQQVT